MARHGYINLREHDFEEAAEYISKHTREKWHKTAAAVVYPDGHLGLVRASQQEVADVSKQNNCIGVYGPGSRIENIEDDILFWLQGFNNHLRKTT
jgi:hypothetical protein